jgi:ribosomal protein L11 methyltransferase
MALPAATWKLQLDVPAAAVELFSSALQPFSLSVASFGASPDSVWTVEGYAAGQPDHARLGAALLVAAAAAGVDAPALRCEPLADRDWLEENRQSFRPVSVERFFIHASHDRGPAPSGAIAIEIDAATAFGSGRHGSTYGCLLALGRLAPALRRAPALDVGCGSGILAIALAKRSRGRVVATDIDPEAVRVCRENLRKNRVGAAVQPVRSERLDDRRVRAAGGFGLIVANILARPLMVLARDITENLREDGALVLSGLLAGQEAQVLGAYRRCGLVLGGRITVDGWRTLILHRARRRRLFRT